MSITLVDAWKILLQETVDGSIPCQSEFKFLKVSRLPILVYFLAHSLVVYDLHSAEESSKNFTYLEAAKE